jgi:gamma-glutamylcyclotransferase (GGCT)/AIG2-like uncharacterized protein YtfP
VAADTSTGERLPFFFYGSLRQGETAEGLLEGAVARRVSARASGSPVQTDARYPGAVFARSSSTIHGELVWLDPARYDGIVERLDAYEGVPDLFRRVTLTAYVGDEPVAAYAYEYARGLD